MYERGFSLGQTKESFWRRALVIDPESALGAARDTATSPSFSRWAYDCLDCFCLNSSRGGNSKVRKGTSRKVKNVALLDFSAYPRPSTNVQVSSLQISSWICS